MTDAGFHHFRPTLDPTAQEFIPTYTYPYPYATTVTLPFFTNQIYYSLPSPPPPPPPAVTLPPPSPVPTRVLLLSSVPTHVSESTVRRELEVFGDVRAVQMDRILDGIVIVHFYDLRQAMAALNEIKEQHMQQQNRLRIHFDGLTAFSRINPIPLPPPARGLLAGRAIWAQFTFPVDAGVPDGYNQGTVSVFNLDSDVSTRVLKGIFEAYGCVKEVRDAPFKKNQKFVEFYDTRDAGKAVAGVNNQEINGKQVVVEFSRPGGHKFRYKQNKLTPISAYRQSPSPPSCRKDRPVEYGGGREVSNVNLPRNGGLKKNGKSFYKHQQPPETHLRWLSGDGGGGFGGRSKPWKGSSRYYNKEKCDPRFLIKEDGVISSFGDTRTTVMIKNIPNKYSQKLLLNLLDNHCIQCNEQAEGGGGGGAGDNQPLASYDFVYLPIDFVNKCNVGYGFVNMTSPEATWRLYKSFHHQNWEVFNSKKICEVSYARLQGLEALKDHFKNSKFPREVEEYMPVTFSPPRDGRTLTEPSPIIGRSITSTTTTSSWSSLMSSEVGCNDLTDGRSCDNDNNLLEEDTKSDTTITISTTGDSSSGGGDGDGDGDGDDVGA